MSVTKTNINYPKYLTASDYMKLLSEKNQHTY